MTHKVSVAAHLQSPYDQLPPEVQEELINDLVLGNDPRDLAIMVLTYMNHEQMLVYLTNIRNYVKDADEPLTGFDATYTFTFGL